ncbi:MAG: flagellar type III secretion system protein FlhB [Acidocella sp.]|nr:flagellar type III secretion system protein FlhB [Acidocella sp.]
MADDSTGDKRHAPTARRLAQAASRGDVVRPADLPKAAAIVAFALLTFSAAAAMGGHVADICAASLSQAGFVRPGAARYGAMAFGAIMFPLLGLVAGIGLLGSFATGGLILNIGQLRPDFSKLLPHVGLGQLISAHGVSDTGKALMKFVLIGGIGALAVIDHGPEFAALAAMAHPSAAPVLRLCLAVLMNVCVVLSVLALADMALQLWLHRRRLRMTDADMREEMKDAAGNPQMRQRQRMVARKMARARQMSKIAEASVIVTNPTHYAVAIRYRRGADRAPMLLAKGVGMLAEEIIARGRGHGIPVVEAPPLARAVYRHVEPGEHVPVALYRACAEVLAYVWKLQRWRAAGGKRPLPIRMPDQEIEVSRWGK